MLSSVTGLAPPGGDMEAEGIIEQHERLIARERDMQVEEIILTGSNLLEALCLGLMYRRWVRRWQTTKWQLNFLCDCSKVLPFSTYLF